MTSAKTVRSWIATLSLVCSFFSLSAAAQMRASAPLSAYAVSGLTRAQLAQVGQKFEVDRVLDRQAGAYEVLVPANQQSEFLQLVPAAQLLEKDSSQASKKVFAESRTQSKTFFSSAPSYHSFDEVVSLLHSTAQAHPDVTVLENYGQSQMGKPLLALRLSTHLKDGSARPRVLLTASTHGDEIITTEVLLSLMNDLITQSQSNPRFAKILDQLEIDFIPVVNPDGFSLQDRYDNGADPNRSYPYPDKPVATPTASIAAELKYIEAHPMVGSIDFHAYSGLVMYPWGYTQQPLESSAKAKFEAVTEKMAATNQYGHGQISELLYVAVGSSVDYYFWKYKALSLGIELGDSKAPPPSEFPKYILEQQESTWIYLESFLK